MARDLFQPKNDTQTSMVLVRRFSESERSQALKDQIDYPVFMAVTEKIGHDKRGNVIFRRTDSGEDFLVCRTEPIMEIDQDTGKEVIRTVEVTDRLVDDELPEIADAYLEWLVGQAS